MRALFINPGGIGDQILLLPTVNLLKERFPECEIDLITEPRSICIGEVTKLYRKIKEFDFKEKNPKIFRLIELIRTRRYKYLISAGSSYKANILASLGNAEIKIGFYRGIFSKIFLTHAVTLNKNQYTANMFSDLLLPIIPGLQEKVKENNLLPEIKLSAQSIEWSKETLNPRIKDRYYAKKIFIHPGVSKLSIQKNISKGWTSKYWATLIEKLLENTNFTVILLGGKEDTETIAEIYKKLSFFARPKNYFDFSTLEMSLEKLAALISFSDLLVCVDSAPMHLGVALGKKLVAFFGPTDPKKLLPNDPRFLAVQAKDSEVTPEIILNAINKQLELIRAH